jgi:SsrA-binding protein
MRAMAKVPENKTVCLNRRARFDYEILDRFEMGMALAGSEVKALREGKGNLADSYVDLRDGRLLLVNMEISPYSHDHSGTLATRRSRPLLMHAAEIRRLATRTREKGLTLVPLSVYFKGPWAKLEVALARGKRKGDKRQAIRKREAQRDIDRARRRR